jgi:hypothetical protein
MATPDRICNLLELCGTPEAPLCPLQDATLKNGIWYGDEPICQSQMFENLPWIKNQKAIAALKLKADDGFFTVRMLNSIKTIDGQIKGADPEDDNAEQNWLQEHHKGTDRQGKRYSRPAVKHLPADARLF